MSISSSLRHTVVLVLLVGGGFMFLSVTNPRQLPLPLLVLPFIWVFCLIFYAVWLATGRIAGLQKGRRRSILAGFSAALPVILLVFQSIHQLTIRDVILAISIVALVSFYMSRANFLR